MQAADVSNWSGAISPEQAACLRAHHIARLICGTQRASITHAQIAAATAAGIACDAYVFLDWRADATAQVRAARAAIAGLPAGRLWIDCEDTPGVATPAPAVVCTAIRAAIAACAPMPCGIYTRRAWWIEHTGDAREFSATGLPLWDARYIAHEGAAVPPFVPYGAWTRAAMTQWHDTTTLCGVSLCLDEVEEGDVTDSEAANFQPQIDELRAGIGALLRNAGALGATCDARARETALLLALIIDGRTEEARRRLLFEMTAAGQGWPEVGSEK